MLKKSLSLFQNEQANKKMHIKKIIWTLAIVFGSMNGLYAQMLCMSCHTNATTTKNFDCGGMLYTDTAGKNIVPSGKVWFLNKSGKAFLANSRANGEFWVLRDSLPFDTFQVKIGKVVCRSWHHLIKNADCNSCHNAKLSSTELKKPVFPRTHPSLPYDNSCKSCHDDNRTLSQIRTLGTLDTNLAPFVVATATRNPAQPNRPNANATDFEKDASQTAKNSSTFLVNGRLIKNTSVQNLSQHHAPHVLINNQNGNHAKVSIAKSSSIQ